MRFESRHDEVRDPVEEPRQVKRGNNKHHRKQQYNGTEVDKTQRLDGCHNPERHHQYRPDDTCTRAVDLHSRKLAQHKDEITAKKNGVGSEELEVG